MTSVMPPWTGSRVRALRQTAGLTQRELADAAGLSITVVRDLEQGITRLPRAATLARLAAALATTAEALSTPSGRLARSEQERRRAATGVHGNGTHRDGPQPESTMPLRLRVLGPLVAWNGDIALGLGSHRDRAVLAMLALHPGQLVHREALIAVIWQFMPAPTTAVVMIQNAISRLRRTLTRHGAPPVLATVGSCYQLLTSRVDLDLIAYTQLADAAAAAARRGDHKGAWDLYDKALALWADDPAADVELLRETPVLTGLRARQASLVADYAEEASSHGHHARVLPHLLPLTERDPFDERAHACLMIAQAGLGNKNEALAVYDRMRARLHNDGLTPGERLRDAQTRILRGDLVYRPRPLT